jgi:hypothetical protein
MSAFTYPGGDFEAASGDRKAHEVRFRELRYDCHTDDALQILRSLRSVGGQLHVAFEGVCPAPTSTAELPTAILKLKTSPWLVDVPGDEIERIRGDINAQRPKQDGEGDWANSPAFSRTSSRSGKVRFTVPLGELLRSHRRSVNVPSEPFRTGTRVYQRLHLHTVVIARKCRLHATRWTVV